tara:strand:+ start:89033 stop:89347 length:315 start_codon:yes stop_codon:yes gene_type:complete
MKNKDFDPNSLTPVKLKKKSNLAKDLSVEFFKDNQVVARALAESILEGDREAFYEIFCGYLAVVNKEKLSRTSNVPIATIRRMAAGSNFTVENMLKVTKQLRAS